MRIIWVWLWIASAVLAGKVSVEQWEKGKTFSDYLTSRNIPSSLLQTIEKSDMQFLSDIQSGEEFYELKDKEGNLEQALIPIGEEMQIRVGKEYNSTNYSFDIIPIEYKEEEYGATVSIENNLYTDVGNTLNHSDLARKIGQLFKGTVNTQKFQKGDKVSFVYTQKTRMGKPCDMPHVKIALLESNGKKQFIYADEDGYGYTSDKKSQSYTVKGKKKVTYTRRVPASKKSSTFGMPLRHARLTSSFSYRRFHPILKRYRPHHGTDFGAKRGTPLLAVNSGKVSFAGQMTGYGNVVKIRHTGGYESLYAHQSRMRVKTGQQVTKGQIIGYVGTTGSSTGTHLHFGLLKNGRWMDPMKVLSRSSAPSSVLKKFTEYKDITTTKYKEVAIKDAGKNKAKLLKYLKEEGEPFVWNDYTKISMKVENGKSN